MQFARSIREMFRHDKVSLAIISLAGLTLIYFTLSRHRVTTNPLSRIITVERLVEAGTFAHTTPEDSTPFRLSVDHVKVKGNVYSSKPPTYPLLMAGESLLLKAVTGMNFYEHQVDYVRYLVLLNQVLPYLLMLLMALFLMQTLGIDKWATHFMLLALSFGILPFGYAVTINNHSLSAVLLFISFWLTWRITRQGKNNLLNYLAVGLISGFAVANDLPSGVFLICLLGLLAWRSPARATLALAGMIIPFVVSGFIFYSITGKAKPFYMQSGLYRYEGSYWTHPEGWDTRRDPKGVYLLNITVGHHGMFSISPVLLLALLAIPRWIRRKDFPLRIEFTLILLYSLSLFLYILMRTYNYGGYCVGMRWFLSFMPLFMFTALPLISELGKKTSGKAACILILLLSLPWNFEALYWEGFIQSGFEKWWMQTIGI